MAEKTLIFDFDGVFVDSFKVSLEAIQNLHKKYNLPDIDVEDLKKLFCGNLWEEHAQYGLDEKKEDEFKKELLHDVERQQERIHFFPHVERIIKEIAKKNTNLIIITSNKTSSVEAKLAEVGLREAFSKILGADKPGNKQEKIIKILENLDGKEDVYFISDTLGDLREVENLPLKTIGVTWGFHSRERLEKASPNYLVDNPDELLAVL